MEFKEILGHDKIKKYLLNSFKNDKLSHAYIFAGKDGVGKSTLAKKFAMLIHCEEKTGCGKCHGCIRVKKDSHPDLKVLSPDGNSIKNKQIEEFQNQMSIKPYDSNKKLFIIDDAGSMTTSAQNRLLKVFEEPPEYGIVILVTDNIYKLLPTILSRGQILNFIGIPKNIMEDTLEKRYNIDNSLAQLYSDFSEGSLGKAIQFIEDEEFLNRRSRTIDIIDSILRDRNSDIYGFVTFMEDNKDNIDEILGHMLYWFRDVIIYKETGNEDFIMNKDFITSIKKHSLVYSKAILNNGIQSIKDIENRLKSNVNFGLCIETLLLNIQEGR